MTYAEKLKDPRWQKKRLKILERDNFTCQGCGNTKKTLHVHHMKYDKEPWLIDDESLTTLCDSCHEIFHHSVNLIKNKLEDKKSTVGMLISLESLISVYYEMNEEERDVFLGQGFGVISGRVVN